MERTRTTDNSSKSNATEGASRKGGVPLIALGLGAAAVGGLAFFASTALSSPMSFDSDKWKNEPCCRQRMVKSLESTHHLSGMTKDEIRALLGNADKETETAWQYTYSGQNAGLDLNWDSNGKVAAP